MSEKYTHQVVGIATAFIHDKDGEREATPEELEALRVATWPSLAGSFSQNDEACCGNCETGTGDCDVNPLRPRRHP